MKELEKEFQNCKAQQDAFFDSITEAIIILDLHNNVIKMNQACVNLSEIIDPRMSPEAIFAIYEIMLPDGERLSPKQWPIHKALHAEYVHNMELKMRNKRNGKTYYFEFNTIPVRNEKGDVIQIIVRFRDLTERKRIEISDVRLAAIVESSNDAIIGKDLSGIITSWNAAAERIFGYSADEILGQPMSLLIPDDRQQEETLILKKIKHDEKIEHFETIRKRKDGKLINISAMISPIKNHDNKIIGASKIVRDVTEQRQLEEQLRQSQKMEAIGQLTGGVAHDFNNLLGVILGNLDLLEELVQGNEEALKRVQNTIKAAIRGADLTKRLLAFSRLQKLNPAPTSLEKCINSMVGMLTQTFGPEIKIMTQLDKSAPMVFVDAAELENTLLNLAVNARDAMPKGGTITISTQIKKLQPDYSPVQTGDIKAGVYVCLSVTDTGQGMSRKTMERAFEPFFTTKPRGKGTGLGLSMVYGFIKQSGGNVRIYSEPDHGTTVSLYLPLATAVPIEDHHAIELQDPKSSGIVLVVDDEVDLLEIAVVYLKKMGYEVLQATNAIDALAIVEQEPNIDLLITDIIMPGGINGIELARRVRGKKHDIFIIYTSGFPLEALAERSGMIIDSPLINKPFQRDEFVTAIRQVMKK